jgi:hypothetical protein
MAKINKRTPRTPQFPWDLRSLVRPKELERSSKVKPKGDPKRPATASRALLEFIGPAHGSDELRLPLPPLPPGHEADLVSLLDRPQLAQFIEREDGDVSERMEQALPLVRAAEDRRERLRALLGRERQMRKVVRWVQEQVEEIERKRQEETKERY